ncbi:hypothetical protein TIFTF001_009712 [Ficus carica]|uniref:Uncharacterized protein n=1 Tax=Ficus carica TaxID=3494 RepID=A0AA88DHJ4_FICCA|nr:hypothetical protein TIFTF001_009712 [Ficus carica]
MSRQGVTCKPFASRQAVFYKLIATRSKSLASKASTHCITKASPEEQRRIIHSWSNKASNRGARENHPSLKLTPTLSRGTDHPLQVWSLACNLVTVPVVSSVPIQSIKWHVKAVGTPTIHNGKPWYKERALQAGQHSLFQPMG